MIQAVAFYLFSAVLIAAAVLTIASRNPVHGVLWLILAFFNAAGLMLIVGAEFIAMLLVIVYVGAVAVLFLFVVMMLEVDFAALRKGAVQYLPFGLLLAAVIAAELILALGSWSAGSIGGARTAPVVASASNIQAIGQLLYTKYVFVFELAGLVLLVALIGAIVLTNRKRSNVLRQNISRQNARRPQDATRLTAPTVGEGVQL